MSPERAKVFVAEDNEFWQKIIKRSLADKGHEVVLSATNLEDALAATSKLVKLGVQVAIIDGNLNDYEANGHDGQIVLAAIRKAAPQVKTIGLSGNSVRGVNVDLGKDNFTDLGKTVTKI
ncbi:MAG: response regulator [Candidatus Levybacteria bacterium]|nr:response regulator [Candidatus Levybacteria bacterium]